MTVVCRAGHDSESDDYTDQCGAVSKRWRGVLVDSGFCRMAQSSLKGT
jgi:hypothetical protein